jgi:hypothetical protein
MKFVSCLYLHNLLFGETDQHLLKTIQISNGKFMANREFQRNPPGLVKNIDFFEKIKTCWKSSKIKLAKKWQIVIGKYMANRDLSIVFLFQSKISQKWNWQTYGKSWPKLANRVFGVVFKKTKKKIWNNLKNFVILARRRSRMGFDIIIVMSMGGLPKNNYKLSMFANRAHYVPFSGPIVQWIPLGALLGPSRGLSGSYITFLNMLILGFICCWVINAYSVGVIVMFGCLELWDLKLDFSYVEEFDELFQQCKKEFDNGVLIPGDGQPDTQVPAMIVDKVGETKVAACVLVKAKAKATSSPQAKSKASEATESDKEFGKLWADATKLRMALISVLGSAQQMLDTMATGVEWEWAHHPIQQAFVWGWTPSTPQQSQTNIKSENIKIKCA